MHSAAAVAIASTVSTGIASFSRFVFASRP
jgi:hypothetical protein